MGNHQTKQKNYHVYVEDFSILHKLDHSLLIHQYLKENANLGDHLIVLSQKPEDWRVKFTHEEFKNYHVEIVDFDKYKQNNLHKKFNYGDNLRKDPADTRSFSFEYWLKYYHRHFHHHFFKDSDVTATFIFSPYDNERTRLLGTAFVFRNIPNNLYACDTQYGKRKDEWSFRKYIVRRKNEF